jgi:hypothetical protein
MKNRPMFQRLMDRLNFILFACFVAFFFLANAALASSVPSFFLSVSLFSSYALYFFNFQLSLSFSLFSALHKFYILLSMSSSASC